MITIIGTSLSSPHFETHRGVKALIVLLALAELVGYALLVNKFAPLPDLFTQHTAAAISISMGGSLVTGLVLAYLLQSTHPVLKDLYQKMRRERKFVIDTLASPRQHLWILKGQETHIEYLFDSSTGYNYVFFNTADKTMQRPPIGYYKNNTLTNPQYGDIVLRNRLGENSDDEGEARASPLTSDPPLTSLPPSGQQVTGVSPPPVNEDEGEGEGDQPAYLP